MATILCCLFSACTSDNEDIKKIVLDSDQTESVTVGANQNSEQIRFTASAPWSAYTSTDPDEVNEVEWIHLDDTHGSAGEVYLNFQLDYNDTGSSRTAYIIILCEDTKTVISITQSTEDDPSVGNPIMQGAVHIEVNRYDGRYGEGFYLDGTTTYEIFYENGLPVYMISEWRDDIDPGPNPPADHDSYCLNREITHFSWNGNNRSDVKSVRADMQTNVTYYPSERTETEDPSEHYADIENGRAVSGWYWWPREDLNKTEWTAAYDSNGFLTSSRNNDASEIWETHSMTWTDDNLTKIICDGETGRTITINYADPSLLNLHHEFDINWILPKELECYDFAAGDITKIFASIGMMGNSSKNLITAITEYDGSKTTYSYRMNYSENTKERTVVTVMHFVNDVQTSYMEWTIKYTNIQ